MNPINYIDLRVTSLDDTMPLYEALLPELAYIHTHRSGAWKIFSTADKFPSGSYFGIMGVPSHLPNDNMIGFWVNNPSELDRLAEIVRQVGGKIVDGPRRSHERQLLCRVF